LFLLAILSRLFVLNLPLTTRGVSSPRFLLSVQLFTLPINHIADLCASNKVGFKSSVIKVTVKRLCSKQREVANGEVHDVWEFDNFDWTSAKLNTRVGSLFNSGNVAAWKRWVSRVASWNDTIWQHKRHANRNDLKGILLEDNAVVVFYIHLFLSVVAAFAFVYEIWDRIMRACKLGYKYICVSLREFARTFKRSFCRGRKISLKREYAVTTT